MSLLRFIVLLSIKVFARLFYRFDLAWVGQRPSSRHWDDISLALILNHTSLLEPIFAGILPIPFLWRIALRGTFPAADITLMRPIAGFMFRALAPQVVSLSRKRDETWQNFLRKVDPRDILLFMPEGRMKRPNGLDKHGKPMTVKSGVTDVLELLGKGHMLLAYSGGLHALMSGRKLFPRLFQRLEIRLEVLDIASYVSRFQKDDGSLDRMAMVQDFETRRDRYCKK